MYGDPPPLPDSDTRWNQLVNDPAWRDDTGIGGWNFLDPIGFRYYLPAAMKRSIARGAWTGGLEFQLCYDTHGQNELRARRHALLDARQRASVARFLLLMIELDRERDKEQAEENMTERDLYRAALDSHWRQYLPST